MTCASKIPLLAASLWACCLLASFPVLAAEPGTAPVLQAGHGFLMVRIIGANNEQNPRFEFTNQGSADVVKVNTTLCKRAGPKARICVLEAKPGRYFWSKYESGHRVRMEDSRYQDPPIIREKPGSASDTFEIVAGVINYIGDWHMVMSAGNIDLTDMAPLAVQRRWSVDIKSSPQTLQRLFTDFPEYTSKYHIFLSMMGKKALSLQEFLELVEKQSK